MKIDNIVFYNWGHNGDIHYSKEFVKDLIKKIKAPAFYQTKCNKNILKDVNVEVVPFSMDRFIEHEILFENTKNNLFINTWIGSSNRVYLINGGCCLDGNYKKYQKIYDSLNLKIEKKIYYIPEINFNLILKDNIDIFLSKYVDVKKILFCNGNVLSGQAINFNMNDIILELANKYKDCLFILTDSSNPLNKDNIKYTKDIINIRDNDLNEISYISTFCDIIIGRGSGPYCFSTIKSNLLNKNKIFIGFTNLIEDAKWANNIELNIDGAEQIWYNQNDKNVIIEIIENKIKNL